MSEEHEKAVEHCNSLAQLREIGKKKSAVIPAVLDSIAPVKILLTDIMHRLELHGNKFQTYPAASDDSLETLWSELLAVDQSLEYGGCYQKTSLEKYPGVVEFLKHCCQSRHYSFTIKKCAQPTCTVCRPVRMPIDIFSSLHFLPDPIPGKDGHYYSFTDIYGKSTSEEHRPTLQKPKGRQNTLPFVASVQHVKNVDIMIQGEECEMWRLVYSKYKLTETQRKSLNSALDDFTFTCGAQLQDLGLDFISDDICTRIIHCFEPVCKLYYSIGIYEQICIHCCSNRDLITKDGYFPQCDSCIGKALIKKRK